MVALLQYWQGKIHVTLNGRLHLQLPVPQLFQDGADSHEQSTETEVSHRRVRFLSFMYSPDRVLDRYLPVGLKSG